MLQSSARCMLSERMQRLADIPVAELRSRVALCGGLHLPCVFVHCTARILRVGRSAFLQLDRHRSFSDRSTGTNRVAPMQLHVLAVECACLHILMDTSPATRPRPQRHPPSLSLSRPFPVSSLFPLSPPFFPCLEGSSLWFRPPQFPFRTLILRPDCASLSRHSPSSVLRLDCASLSGHSPSVFEDRLR